MKKEILGIDIGGVIIDRVRNDGTDTSFFSDNYLNTSAVPGAFDAINNLVAQRFKRDNVHLVSKCGPRVQKKTLDWLEHHCFHELTWLPRENVHFCLERHQKAEICAKLGITHFIDDRLEVLSHLVKVRNLFLFRPDPAEVRRYAQHLPRVYRVESWAEVEGVLLS